MNLFHRHFSPSPDRIPSTLKPTACKLHVGRYRTAPLPALLLIGVLSAFCIPTATFAGGTVTAEIYTCPSSVDPGELVDVRVRVKFSGDDNDGPWQVTDLDVRDDDGITYNNIAQRDSPFSISSQDTWYYYWFHDVNLSAYDDGGDGIELFVWAEVDDNDFNGYNPDGRSSVFQVKVNETTSPSAPGVPDMNSSDDTGSSSSDNITYDTSPRFSWSAASDASGIAGYYWAVDDSTPESGGTWTTSRDANPSGVGNGSHYIYVKAKDNAGNIGPYSRLQFTVDTSAPSAPGTPDLNSSDDTGSSSSDDITSDTSPRFSWSSSSDSSGIHGYYWAVDDSTPDSGGTWTTSRDAHPSGISDGSHYLYVKAKDVAGNIGSYSRVQFRIDTTPPNVPSIIYPSVNQHITDTTPAFDWSGSDNSGGSGIWKYHLLVETDALGINKIDEYPTSSSYDTPPSEALDAGGAGYDWELWAYDIAGNQSSGTGEKRFYVISESFISAYWWAPLDAYHGATVTMCAEVEGIPVDAQCSFQVYEDDGVWPLDDTIGSPVVGTVYSAEGKTYVKATWSAVWQDDWSAGGFGGDPEHYFKVTYNNLSLYSSQSREYELIVRQSQLPSAEHGDFYYSGGEATQEAALTADRIPLIMVHGASGDKKVDSLNYWYGWVNDDPSAPEPRFNQSDMRSRFRVYRYVYDSSRSIGDNGQDFAAFVDQFYADTPDLAERQVVVMAHSMGGLVSRYALNTSASFRDRVHRLITLGTPHLGSPLANPSWVRQAYPGTSDIGEFLDKQLYYSRFGGSEGDFGLAWHATSEIPLSALVDGTHYNWIKNNRLYNESHLDGSLTSPFTGSANMLREDGDSKIVAYGGSFTALITGMGEGWPDEAAEEVTHLCGGINDHEGLDFARAVMSSMQTRAGQQVGANDGLVPVSSALLGGAHAAVEKVDLTQSEGEQVDHSSYLDVASTMDYVAKRLLTMVKVTISPQSAVDAGARWRIAGGAWQKTGVSLNALKPGQYTIEFKHVAGWTRPSNQTITVTENQTYTLNGTPATYTPGSPISVTPASRDFGPIEAGTTAELSFTVQNVGGGVLSGTASVSAPYSIVSGGTYSLGAGASQTVTVRYSPTAAGTHNRNVTFTGGGGVTRPVTGSAYLQPANLVTPASRDFGSIEAGTTAELSFTVQNVGGGVLSGTASVSAPYSIVSGGTYSLGAGASQTVMVRYSPTAAGTHSQDVTFTGGGGMTRQVFGSAYPATVPTAIIRLVGDLAFGSVTVGSTATRTMTIYNDGNSLLNVSSVSCPSGFSGNWSGTIPAGDSRDLFVMFSPNSTTNYGGTLTVSSDATMGTSTKAISGTGIAPDSLLLFVATSALPHGSGGRTYVADIEAIGGVRPYSWELASGNLPSGISLVSDTGSVVGTPTTSGIFAFRVRITDSQQQYCEKDFTLFVEPQRFGAWRWSELGDMSVPRANHRAVVLDDGKVLVSGGTIDPSGSVGESVDIFDPETGSISAAAPLNVSRSHHEAVRLGDGRILVAGGSSAGGAYLSDCEIYDPVSDRWSVTGSLNQPSANHRLALVDGGKVFLYGGSGSGSGTKVCELYDPVQGQWVLAGQLGVAHQRPAGRRLADGKVIAAGGYMFNSMVELYDPTADSWSTVGQIRNTVAGNELAVMVDGQVCIAGGSFWSGNSYTYSTVDIYNPIAGTIASGPDMLDERCNFGLVRLTDGSLMAFGGIWADGSGASGPLATAEFLRVGASSWEPGPALNVPRSDFASALSGDGVFAFGGWKDGLPLASVEKFAFVVDPLRIEVASRLPDAEEGHPYSVELTATGGRSPYGWFVSRGELPNHISLDPPTGTIFGTAEEYEGPELYDFTVSVVDSSDPPLLGSADLCLFVAEVNTAPSLAPVPDQRVTEGSLLSLYMDVFDPDLPKNTLTVYSVAELPNGCELDPVTGLLSWTPTEDQGPNSYTLVIAVTDEGDPALTETQSFLVTVDELNTAPTLASVPDQFVEEGSTLSLSFSAADVDLPANTLTFALQGEVPDGLTLDPTTGLLLWTPAEDQGPSSYTITVAVTDDGDPALTETQSFLVTVDEPARCRLTLTCESPEPGSAAEQLVKVFPAPEADGAYAPGTELTLQASPGDGYNFIAWYGDAFPYLYAGMHGSTALVERIVIDQDVSVEAWFRRGPDAFANIGHSTGAKDNEGTTESVTTRGGDVWGTADSLSFSYTLWKGDFDFVLQVYEFDATDIALAPEVYFAKAGIMVRSSLDPESPNVFLQMSTSRGSDWIGTVQARYQSGGDTVAPSAGRKVVPYPHACLRLVRIDNTFRAFWFDSSSAIHSHVLYSWRPIATLDVELPETVYVGFATTAASEVDVRASFSWLERTQHSLYAWLERETPLTVEGESDAGSLLIRMNKGRSMPLHVPFFWTGGALSVECDALSPFDTEYYYVDLCVLIPAEQDAVRYTMRPKDDNWREGLEEQAVQLYPSRDPWTVFPPPQEPDFGLLTPSRLGIGIVDDEDPRGGLHRQIFKDIPGADLADLTASERFPSNPTSEDYITSLESVLGAQNYGVRISGYLIPPQSGDYVFYLASDDASQLFLSPDHHQESKQLIVAEPKWNVERNWEGDTASKPLWDPWYGTEPYPQRKSDPIALKAGVPYYVELLHKQGEGSDYVGVAWRFGAEAAPVNLSEPIPGEVLAFSLPPVVVSEVTFSSKAVVITWQGGGSLEGSRSLFGPWEAVSEESPASLSTETAEIMFFRAVRE